MSLTVSSLGVTTGAATPYMGRYPAGSLIYNDVWYYGTYCLLDDKSLGMNWPILGPFVGFRISYDYGKTWVLITNGMNPSGSVNVVREDPKKAGLLYAGTEREVYFSADNGEHWQSLRNNMPATSIRDLVIHEDDLVIGTHGRSIWILDNILRENSFNICVSPILRNSVS